jgi:hypothetical protein
VFFHNYAKELYAKLINTKSTFSKYTNHKILLIEDSHLRGYSEMMKSQLNNQFHISGFDNLTANDFIILCCGSNDIGKVKLNMVLNDFIEASKESLVQM